MQSPKLVIYALVLAKTLLESTFCSPPVGPVASRSSSLPPKPKQPVQAAPLYPPRKPQPDCIDPTSTQAHQHASLGLPSWWPPKERLSPDGATVRGDALVVAAGETRRVDEAEEEEEEAAATDKLSLSTRLPAMSPPLPQEPTVSMAPPPPTGHPTTTPTTTPKSASSVPTPLPTTRLRPATTPPATSVA